MRRLGFTACLLCCFRLISLAAQDAVSPDNITLSRIPDTRSNWTVEVRTSGGLTGQGTGGFTLTSEGRLTCNSPKPCDRQIQKPALQTISGIVDSMDLSLWFRQSLAAPSFLIRVGPSLCSDCIATSMVLHIRDSNLTEWTYQASWDVTTQSALPPDFKRIFDAATALAK